MMIGKSALQQLPSYGPKPRASDRPWSFSQLDAFETCPRKWAEESLWRRFKQPKGAAQSEGDDTHLALKKRCANGKPLPLRLRQHERAVSALLNRIPDAEIAAEERIGINPNGDPVDFFAPDVWCRGVIDLIAYNEALGVALVVDWKTGKVRPKYDQLDLMALLVQSLIPSIKRIGALFYWTRDPKAMAETKRSYALDDMPRMWMGFLERNATFQEAVRKEDFPPKPNFLCAKFCPVASCEHHGIRQ
jgi:hypothetical protein